jgi:hypothetical protein
MDTNPFLYQNIVKDADLFYGRKNLLQQVAEHIIKGESCAIVGEHKIGKSSILNLLVTRSSWGDIVLNHEIYKIVYFDFQSDPFLTPSLLWKTLLQDIAAKIADPEVQENVRRFCLAEDILFRDVRLILENIKQKNYKVVLLFDEFDYLAEHLEHFGMVFIDAFRSLTREYLVMVVAARKKISDLFPKRQGSTSPLHNVFETMSVGLLEESAALDLISQVKKPALPSLVDERDLILQTAGKHPFVLQRLCYHVFNNKRENQYSGSQLIERSVAECYEDLIPFFDDIWVEASAEQRQILIDLTRSDQHELKLTLHGMVGKSIRELRDLGLIEVTGDRIVLFSRLFAQYIEQEQASSATSRHESSPTHPEEMMALPATPPSSGKEISPTEGPSSKSRSVHISYAWGDEREEMVDQIDLSLQRRGLRIIRDKRDLEYKGSIREFMERIGRGDCVIVVISDKYLRSPNCMFELVEISENKQFQDRIFPIVWVDANIYNPLKRIGYIKYWEEKRAELAQAIKTLDPANLQGIREEIDLYDRIRNKISGLTSILKDMNALTPEMHRDSDFSQLYNAIERQIKNPM